MTESPSPSTLRVAVVGHTNTGKTSLLRTLLRDVSFGDVADRPAVTRVVERAILHARSGGAIEFFDTPGLEDSIGMLEALDDARDRQRDDHDALRAFLDDEAAGGRFAQEAAGLRQVLDADAALYVVDARDRVLSRHRDELEILTRCARPIVPVLNFTAATDARTDEWRDTLRRLNLHAVAEFDTVIFDARGEERLYEKLRSLVDAHAATIDAIIADRRDERGAVVRGSAHLIAELLIDCAAYMIVIPGGASPPADVAEAFRRTIREREDRAVRDLLALHRFGADDVLPDDVPVQEGTWSVDLFSRDALKQFGYSAGGGAAAGAMVGLTLDAMVGGLSGGAGALAGATVGGLLGTLRSHGRRIADRMRGVTELRCEARTLDVLALRAIALARALLRRGHASVERVERTTDALDRGVLTPEIRRVIDAARRAPSWSRLDRATRTVPVERERQEAELATALTIAIRGADAT